MEKTAWGRGGPGTRTTRGVRWPAGEEARVRVGSVTACARDEARLGWSPGDGDAARSDRSGGEDEATKKKAAETERKRTREGRRAWFIKGDR